MTRRLTGFLTEQDARAKSEALFAPFKHPTSCTEYLLGWERHPETGVWALVVPAEYEAMLPPEDLAALDASEWPAPADLRGT